MCHCLLGIRWLLLIFCASRLVLVLYFVGTVVMRGDLFDVVLAS